MKKEFNPEEWLPKKAAARPQQSVNNPGNDAAAVERALEALKSSGKDITSDYASWRDIGFAFAEAFGEGGREYFHRVSSPHPDYDAKNCDTQYDRCLKSGGSGISLGTFYHHLKEAGIRIPPPPMEVPPLLPPGPAGPYDVWMGEEGKEEEGEKEETVSLPTFPDGIFEKLPQFLQQVTAPAASEEERDVLLLGAMVALSACMPNMYGIYDQKKVYANLYLFVTAPPSAGKGRLAMCKNLVLPIHRARREEARLLREDYEKELAEHNASKNDTRDKPVKPPEKMLFIPANNSTTGLFQLLFENQCHGLLFETEGDTLAQAFKSDYGNYSDGFRKAYHHETISYYRRTEKEYVSLEEPALSTVLSGTPRQVNSLIPNAENGLFSRFLFYYMNLKPVWKDVFAETGNLGMEEHFLQLGEQFFAFHRRIQDEPMMKLVLSRRQKQRFNEFFSLVQLKYMSLQPEDYIASVRRLGLTCFRLAMVLTNLRYMEDEQLSATRQCADEDFETVLQMATVLVQHSSHIFYRLPGEKKIQLRSNLKERFLQALPEFFGRIEHEELSTQFGLSTRTGERYIAEFIKKGLVHRDRKGCYQKLISEEYRVVNGD